MTAKFAGYPALSVYVNGYEPRENDLLRFDGYYDSRPDTGSGLDRWGLRDPALPIFFYRDGSCCHGYNPIERDSLSRNLEHGVAWGNYMISGDTIIMESLVYTLFGYFRWGYHRIIQKGILYGDSINFFDVGDADKSGLKKRAVYFYPFSPKPDSTRNWIRTQKEYRIQ
jgi:hypothetical protein